MNLNDQQLLGAHFNLLDLRELAPGRSLLPGGRPVKLKIAVTHIDGTLLTGMTLIRATCERSIMNEPVQATPSIPYAAAALGEFGVHPEEARHDRDQRDTEQQQIVVPDGASRWAVDREEQVVVARPQVHDDEEAEGIGDEYHRELFQRSAIAGNEAVGNRIEHHDGDDDREHAVGKGFTRRLVGLSSVCAELKPSNRPLLHLPIYAATGSLRANRPRSPAAAPTPRSARPFGAGCSGSASDRPAPPSSAGPDRSRPETR